MARRSIMVARERGFVARRAAGRQAAMRARALQYAPRRRRGGPLIELATRSGRSTAAAPARCGEGPRRGPRGANDITGRKAGAGVVGGRASLSQIGWRRRIERCGGAPSPASRGSSDGKDWQLMADEALAPVSRFYSQPAGADGGLEQALMHARGPLGGGEGKKKAENGDGLRFLAPTGCIHRRCSSAARSLTPSINSSGSGARRRRRPGLAGARPAPKMVFLPPAAVSGCRPRRPGLWLLLVVAVLRQSRSVTAHKQKRWVAKNPRPQAASFAACSVPTPRAHRAALGPTQTSAAPARDPATRSGRPPWPPLLR